MDGAAVLPATPASAGFDALASEAAGEGHRFIAHFVAEWLNGANRFDKPGEAFRGVSRAGAPVAVGGLNADPFLPGDPGTARLRHIHVRPAWRRTGTGEVITRHLLSLAAPRFRRVRLRTGDPGAAWLYERCGFERVAEPDATHALVLAERRAFRRPAGPGGARGRPGPATPAPRSPARPAARP